MEYKQILLYFTNTIPILEVVACFQREGSYDPVYSGNYVPTFQRVPLYAPSF